MNDGISPAQEETDRARDDGFLSDLAAYARFWFAMLVTAVTAVLCFTGSLFGLLMPRKLGRRWMLQFPILWAHCILWAARCPLDIQFEEPLPEGGFLLFANHQSTLDIIALFIVMKERPIAFATKRELFSVPVIGWYLTVAGFIEVDRANRKRSYLSYEKAARQVRDEGAVIAIYPEGTRSIDGTVLPFKKGAFAMAIATQAPIVPAGVDGAQQAVRKHSTKLYGTTIRIRVGKAIPTAGLEAHDRDELLVRTRKAVIALHLAAGGEPSDEASMFALPGKRSGERES